VKRILFALGVAVLFLNFVVPTAVYADQGGGGGSCGSTICKP
jgi:hypothetical protein